MAGRRTSWPAAAMTAVSLAGALALSGFGSTGASAARASATAAPGGWAKAITLGQTDSPSAISCPSAGDCTAVGPGVTPYVLSEVRGTWGNPATIPGLARTKHPSASPACISCHSSSCTVVGSYVDAAGHQQAFVLNRTRGAWGKVSWVPGLASLDRGHSAGLGQLWCFSVGNCAATGSYTDAARTGHPFVVAQAHGTWGRAVPIPTPAGLPGQLSDPAPNFSAIYCSAPGNCSAGGGYPVTGGNQMFLIDQVNGVWGSAIQIPGTGALNTQPGATLNAIACASPGNCSAGGSYWTASQFQDAFVVNQVNGTWQDAIEVPGSLGTGAWINAISCPTPGNCGAGGVYDYENTERPFGSVFVINEVNGTWHSARPIPNTAKINQGDDAAVSSITCPTPENCVAGGYYTPGNAEAFPFWDAFVVTEVNGTWSKAIAVPGTNSENTGVNATTVVTSCAAPSLACAAAGYLSNNKTGFHGFIVSRP